MRRPPLRWWIAAAVGVVVLVALIPVGRWEARRHAARENAGIAKVLREIGPLDQPSLVAFRKGVGPGMDCLLYKRGTNPFALEICFDGQGRVLEAYDRRGTGPVIWSIREDPGRASVRVDRATATGLVGRLSASA